MLQRGNTVQTGKSLEEQIVAVQVQNKALSQHPLHKSYVLQGLRKELFRTEG